MEGLKDLGLIRSGMEPAPNESLFDAGILDSLGMMALVTGLESRYRIRIPETDLLPDNFDSVEAIARYVGLRMEICA